jgi:hypothetical protein
LKNYHKIFNVRRRRHAFPKGTTNTLEVEGESRGSSETNRNIKGEYCDCFLCANGRPSYLQHASAGWYAGYGHVTLRLSRRPVIYATCDVFAQSRVDLIQADKYVRLSGIRSGDCIGDSIATL